MLIGNKDFDVDNNCYIMGILNCTPDSFSDGGKYYNIDDALKHVERMINEGADIIDVGGESTRPGYTKISDEEEINRVVPVIKAIKEKFDITVSVDTYKSQVAKAAILAGADIVNDIWGLKYDENMANIVSEYNVSVVIMHNRNLEENPYKSDVVLEVLEDLKEGIRIAKLAGIKDEKIITDPGIGFGKTLEDNLIVTNNVEKLKDLGYPVLLATSKKSMIGLTLNLPKEERGEGTIATSVLGVIKGCSFVRVHDVKENKRAVLMTQAILGSAK